MQVVINKLSTYDEIIGQVCGGFLPATTNMEGIWLYQPCALWMMQTQQGTGASFETPLLLADDDHPAFFPYHAINMYTESVTEYEKRYLESVSGISLATSLNG